MQIDKQALSQILEDFVPFNKFLGLRLESYSLEPIWIESKIEIKEDYIGNVVRKAPHGGLIATIIDATSGTAAMMSLADFEQISRLSTIDMRVDYLDAAKGKYLNTKSTIIRSGRRIIVVSSQVFDDNNTLVAIGTNSFNLAI